MEFEKQYHLDGALGKVKQALSDMVIYGSIHPLIRSVEKHESEPDVYMINERPYQWLPIHVHYKARLILMDEVIAYEISEIPFTKARINYSFAQLSDRQTKTVFNLKIENALFGKTLLRKMIVAQDSLMEELNRFLSGNINFE